MIIEAGHERRCIRGRSGGRRRTWLVDGIDRTHIEPEIIDRELGGGFGHPLAQRRLDLLTDSRLMRAGKRRLFDGWPFHLRRGASLANARGHLPRRSGCRREAVLAERHIAIGDAGRRLVSIAYGGTDVEVQRLRGLTRHGLAEQIEVDPALATLEVEVHTTSGSTSYRPGA